MGEDEFGAFCEELVGDSVEDPALSGALFHFFGPERRPKATDLTKELWRIGCAKLKCVPALLVRGAPFFCWCRSRGARAPADWFCCWRQQQLANNEASS